MKFDPSEKKPISVVEDRNTKEYGTETNAPALTENPLAVQRQDSLSAMKHHAQQQIAKLQEQANLLMRQAREIEERVQLAELVAQSHYQFTPVLLKPYYLYEYAHPRHSHILTMIGPDEWNGACPYGRFVARVRQLGDSTWEEFPA
jgi:hypothetical protein